MSHKFVNKKKDGWPSLEIIKRKQETDCAYNSLKDFDPTHKDFDDYIKKKEDEIIEHNKLNLPSKENPVINLTTSSLSEDVYVIKSHFINYTEDLGDFCAYVQEKIILLEAERDKYINLKKETTEALLKA